MLMSDGQAERFVDTLKRALSKAQDSAEMLQQFLRGYRATPNPRAPGGLSPAKIIYGRRIRLPLATVLPPQEPPTHRDLAMERQFCRDWWTVAGQDNNIRIILRSNTRNEMNDSVVGA